MPLFNIEYSHPVLSFTIYAFLMAFIISIAFAINEEIDWRIRMKTHNEKVKIKLFSHFIISFFVISIFYSMMYYLFGFGSNLFPLCTYKKFCK